MGNLLSSRKRNSQDSESSSNKMPKLDHDVTGMDAKNENGLEEQRKQVQDHFLPNGSLVSDIHTSEPSHSDVLPEGTIEESEDDDTHDTSVEEESNIERERYARARESDLEEDFNIETDRYEGDGNLAETSESDIQSNETVAEIVASESASSMSLGLSDYECAICYEILISPVRINCGCNNNVFCHYCVYRTWAHSPHCPICRGGTSYYNVPQMEQAVEDVISTLSPSDLEVRNNMIISRMTYMEQMENGEHDSDFDEEDEEDSDDSDLEDF